MTALPTAAESPVSLRVMEVADIGRTARIHQTALPGGFFVALGARFLRAYHRSFLTSPAGLALLAEADGEIVGFIVGTIDEATHYRHVVRRDRWALGARGLFALAANPPLLLRFVRTRAVRYVRGLLRLSRPIADLDPKVSRLSTAGVLNHLAVDAKSRGEGVGSALLAAFEETARALGASRVRLTTAADNTVAQRFYERAGWLRDGEGSDADGHCWIHYARGLR